MAEEHHHHHHKECGGLGEEKQATDKTQNIVDQVSGDVKANSDGRDYSNLKAVSFKKQVVNGFNHFIKVLTGGGNHIHLRVHEPINGQPELHGIQHDKKPDDEIHHFESNVKK